MTDSASTDSLYGSVSERAAAFSVTISPEELAEIAVHADFGACELHAVEEVFSYLADKHHAQVIGTLLKLSRLTQKAPRPSKGSTSAAFADETPKRSGSFPRCPGTVKTLAQFPAVGS